MKPKVIPKEPIFEKKILVADTYLKKELKNFSNRVEGKTNIIVQIKLNEYEKYSLDKTARVKVTCESDYRAKREPQTIFRFDVGVTKSELLKEKVTMITERNEHVVDNHFKYEDSVRSVPSFFRSQLRKFLQETLPNMEGMFKSAKEKKEAALRKEAKNNSKINK